MALESIYSTYDSKIKDWLPQSRIDHSKRVVETALKLASFWTVDKEKVCLAAYFHDIAKGLTPTDCVKRGINLPPSLEILYQQFPSIWHAFAGPYIVEQKFDIHDEDILSAMRWHTTGTAQMSVLSETVFIADYLDPERHLEQTPLVWNYCKKGPDIAILLISMLTIEYLMQMCWPIHPRTLDCYNDYLNKVSVSERKKMRSQIDLILFTRKE